MNTSSSGSVLKTILAAIAAIFGLVLLFGGIYLATLGGSWYYIIAGLFFLATAVLLQNVKAQLLLFMQYWSLVQWYGGFGKWVQTSLHWHHV